MQASRQKILELMKSRGELTVEQLSEALQLTTVTIRHHLDVLRDEGLIDEPVVRHRTSPGRPQYAYKLTDKAADYFPKAYDSLANNLIAWIKQGSSQDQVNAAFDGVAKRFLADAPRPIPGESIENRMARAVEYLNGKGYVAHWEQTDEGYWLHTRNCPFLAVAGSHEELCGVDFVMMTHLLGEIPERGGRVIEGQESCSYLVRMPALSPA